MIKAFILTLLAMLAFGSGISSAQKTDTIAAERLTAAKCFESAPSDVMGIIAYNTRLDMLDYFNAGSDRSSTNVFDGECRIKSLNDDCITLDIANGATMQIFVLNADTKSPIVGVIETVDTPISDSKVQFYNSRWEPINNIAIDPALADWLKPKITSDNRKNVEDSLPFIMAVALYDPENATLSFTHQMNDFFVEGNEEADVAHARALAQLKPTITYKWNGKKFVTASSSK